MKNPSIGGKSTLLKSVLGSTPIYDMSLFKVLMQVNVLASKEKGGLGVSSFFALNHALLFKWVWRFRNDNNSLWPKVIKVVHGEDGFLGKLSNSAIPSIWMDIVRELAHLNVRFRKIQDAWKGDIAFKSLYPRGYALKTCKMISLTSKLAHDHVGVSLHRNPRSEDELVQFIDLVANVDGFQLPVSSKTRRISNVSTFMLEKLDWIIGPTLFNLSRRGVDIHSIVCSNYGMVDPTGYITIRLRAEHSPRTSETYMTSRNSSYENMLGNWNTMINLSPRTSDIGAFLPFLSKCRFIFSREDAWKGDIAFKSLYPRGYALNTCKMISLTSKLAHDHVGVSLHRNPRSEDVLVQFIDLVANVDESTSHVFFACPMAREIYCKIATWWDFNVSEFTSYEEWLVWLKNLKLPYNLKLVLEGQLQVTEAQSRCDPVQISWCLQSFVSNMPPSQDCCRRFKSQESCICRERHDSTFGAYLRLPGARRVASRCGVNYPTCN
ncbi:RNA-directed DNA polymerase, eukaryota, reverse transcriptase zinc-binding domain protein [Tanacetum coccineum]